MMRTAIGASAIKVTARSSLAAIFVLGLALWWWTGGLDKVNAADDSGRAKALALVAAYAKHVGAHDSVHQTLDADNDRSFGDFGFHYFPERDVLQARVYIVRSGMKEWPETAVYEKQVHAGLNDPRYGGMYDRGGGYFLFDDSKQATFLVKNYEITKMTPASFVGDVDNLNSLGGIWITSWFGHVANQIHGAEPVPTQRVTRENDPYKR